MVITVDSVAKYFRGIDNISPESFLAGIMIIAATYVVHRFILKILWRYLEYLTSEKIISTKIDDYFIKYIRMPIMMFIWGVGISSAVTVMNITYLSTLLLFGKILSILTLTGIVAAFMRALLETEGANYAKKYTPDFKYDYLIVQMSGKPVYLMIYLIGTVFSLNEVGLLTGFLAQNALNLCITVLKVFGSVVFSYIVWSQLDYHIKQKVKSAFKDDKKYGMQIIDLFSQVSLYIFFILLFLTIISTLGINFTPWLAGFSAIGLAISFAAQSTLKNILSGVFILVDRPFKVGDYIKIEGGVEGYVHKISLKNMKLRTVSGELITVPNSGITEKVIYNQTAATKLTKEIVSEKKVILRVGISYDSDYELAEKILKKILEDVREVTDDVNKPAQVFLVELGDFSLNFDLEFWSEEGNIKKTKHMINKEILKRFAEAGIRIPYPTAIQYVHIEDIKSDINGCENNEK